MSRTLKVDKKRHKNPSDDSEDCISVFPNPSSDFVTVRLGKSDRVKVVSIFRMDGERMALQEVGEDEVRFNVSGYLNGSYVVKILIDNSIKTIRFNKN